MVVHVDDSGLIIQQVACNSIILILPPNMHEQGLVNPWWAWAIWFQESEKVRAERFTKVLRIFRNMSGVLFGKSKLPHIRMVFPEKMNVITNLSVIIGRNLKLLPCLQNVLYVAQNVLNVLYVAQNFGIISSDCKLANRG